MAAGPAAARLNGGRRCQRLPIRCTARGQRSAAQRTAAEGESGTCRASTGEKPGAVNDRVSPPSNPFPTKCLQPACLPAACAPAPFVPAAVAAPCGDAHRAEAPWLRLLDPLAWPGLAWPGGDEGLEKAERRTMETGEWQGGKDWAGGGRLDWQEALPSGARGQLRAGVVVASRPGWPSGCSACAGAHWQARGEIWLLLSRPPSIWICAPRTCPSCRVLWRLPV